MRAIQVHQPGDVDALVLAELPEPQPGPAEVRVRTRAIGVGRPDVLMRTGKYKWMPPLPLIPGGELAGEIDTLGASVTGWEVGDRVLISARDLAQRGGCYAEAIVVPSSAPYRLPDSVSFDDAVSLPNLQLAYAMLMGLRDGRPDAKSMLITGAAGGVATMLGQLGRHLGLQVLGCARSPEKRAFAMAHGFGAVLDPQAPDLPGQIRALAGGLGVDLAFDPIGGQSLVHCIQSLAPLGTAVSYNIVAGPPSEDVFKVMRSLLGRSLAVRCFSMHTFDEVTTERRALMQKAVDLMASGHVRAPTPTRIPLDCARDAHAILDRGDTIGKIILVPSSS